MIRFNQLPSPICLQFKQLLYKIKNFKMHSLCDCFIISIQWESTYLKSTIKSPEQKTYTYSRSTIETLEKHQEYVQNEQQRHQNDTTEVVLVHLLSTFNIIHTFFKHNSSVSIVGLFFFYYLPIVSINFCWVLILKKVKILLRNCLHPLTWVIKNTDNYGLVIFLCG